MRKMIDLEKYRSDNSRIYAGRDRGEWVRAQERLAELDHQNDVEVIEVQVPVNTFSVTSSFFLGMFGDSIRELGEAEFRRRYQFRGRGVGRSYEAGIREALTTDSPLSAAQVDLAR